MEPVFHSSEGNSSNSSSSAPLQFVDANQAYRNPSSYILQPTVSPGHITKPQGANAFDSNVQSPLDSLTPAFLKTAQHPFACLFHFLFKVVALLCYFFGPFIFGGWERDYVFSFVFTTLLIAIDFWVVKNVSGRLLVGMRWWNMVDEEGENKWFYEAKTDEKALNYTDKLVFWIVLYLWAALWITYTIYHFLRLQVDWILLDCIGVALALSNLIGYWKCSKETKKQIEQWGVLRAMQTAYKQFYP